MRDSPAIVIVKSLLELGASVVAYDPISINKAKEVLPSNVVYVESCAEALKMLMQQQLLLTGMNLRT